MNPKTLGDGRVWNLAMATGRLHTQLKRRNGTLAAQLKVPRACHYSDDKRLGRQKETLFSVLNTKQHRPHFRSHFRKCPLPKGGFINIGSLPLVLFPQRSHDNEFFPVPMIPS